MRILICGGREYADKKFFFKIMDALAKTVEITRIIHGGARGADMMGTLWWGEQDTSKIAIDVYPANWEKHGRSAGAIRNRQMLQKGNPDLVVAFPGGRGTQNMIDISKKAGVKVIDVQKDIIDATKQNSN